ncbi:MAG TPA: hypothetical protein VHJ18_14210 [Streptosporangiaceae bacterium]|jgi:hypothetical protein|nr:hypothetical protein [Streptosporangiaceae bacterium]
METIIGFAAGYLAGTKDGGQGIERIKSSLRDIAQSKEARRLASEAVTMAGALLGRRSAQGAVKTATGLARLVIRQITEGPNDRNSAE